MATPVYPRTHRFVQKSKKVHKPVQRRCRNPLCKKVLPAVKPQSFEASLLYQVPVVTHPLDREASIEYYCPDHTHVQKRLDIIYQKLVEKCQNETELNTAVQRFVKLKELADQVARTNSCRYVYHHLTRELKELISVLRSREEWAAERGLIGPTDKDFPRHLQVGDYNSCLQHYVHENSHKALSTNGFWAWNYVGLKSE